MICPHRPPCAACPRFGEPGIAIDNVERLARFASEHGLPAPTVVAGTNQGFRLRARLAIRGRMNSPKVGVFAADSHRVVHIPECRVHHPLINRVASVVRRSLVDCRVSCYSEAAHLGIARYLQVVIERRSQTAQVVLVANTPTIEPLTECLDSIRNALGDELHSLWFNANCGRGNIILGSDFQHYCGSTSVVEHFGGAAIHYPPGAFGQSNLDVAQSIIEQVNGDIPQNSEVAEFYAGVGAIGLSVIERAAKLRMNEIGPHSLAGAGLGIQSLIAEQRSKVTLVPGAAASALQIADGAQVVLADPPRKGLDPTLRAALSECAPERFIYISCALDSLIEDCRHLTSHGKLRLAQLTAYDLMPFTQHVETVARFERA